MIREIRTVIHEIKRRTLTVKDIENLSPQIRKITFTSEELEGFTSLSPDDHIKIFLPSGEMRDYTPMRFDPVNKELDLCFYLHGNGPASNWALNTKPGDQLIIGGPKGSRIVPYNFDWYLMIGDETAIPGFLRRLREMPEAAPIVMIIEVENEDNIVNVPKHSQLEVKWVFRNSVIETQSDRIIEEIKKLHFRDGDFFSWVSLEKKSSREIKSYLIENNSTHEAWIKATGYWDDMR